MDAERIAYGMGLKPHIVRKNLGEKCSRSREQRAAKEIGSEAWRLVVEKGKNFYDARDVIRVHAEVLKSILSKELSSHGLEDRSQEYYDDAHDYAVKVYKEFKCDIWTVAHALERSEQETKVILDRDYDPYAVYRLEEEPRRKVRKLHEEGLSLGRIKFRLKADDWELKRWIGEDVMTPVKAKLRREVRERYQGGETVQEVCDDIGLSTACAEEYLDGLFEHPLDLFGVGREIREKIGRLYLERGSSAEEMSILTGIDKGLIDECIKDFFWKREDIEQHEQSRKRRCEAGDAKHIGPSRKIEEPAALVCKRKAESSAAAEVLGIDGEKASSFFADGLIPSRAQLFRKMEARQALAKAMFDQGKDLEEIAEAVGASQKIVEGYLGAAYLPTKEKQERSRENVDPREVAIALYRQGISIGEAAEAVGRGKQAVGYALNAYLAWKYPFTDYIAANACEARYLMVDSEMTMYEAAVRMGAPSKRIRDMIGSFGTRFEKGGIDALRKHAHAAYMKDAMRLDDEHIADMLGLDKADIAQMLDDGRGHYDYGHGWRYWQYKDEDGRVPAEDVAKACGLDEDLVMRAARLGMFEGDGDSWCSGSYADSLASLQAMGLMDAHPMPWIDEGGEDDGQEVD